MPKSRNLLIGILAFLILAGGLVFRQQRLFRRRRAGAAFGQDRRPLRAQASDGSTVTDQTYRDKWQLIYFGYTLCPDACPTALNEIAGALQTARARGGQGAADLHHRRSGARHAQGDGRIRQGVRPAHHRPDRVGRRDRHRGARVPRLLRQGRRQGCARRLPDGPQFRHLRDAARRRALRRDLHRTRPRPTKWPSVSRNSSALR